MLKMTDRLIQQIADMRVEQRVVDVTAVTRASGSTGSDHEHDENLVTRCHPRARIRVSTRSPATNATRSRG